MESNYSKLLALGINCKNRAGDQKVVCPKCSHTRKNKKEPCLSVNAQEGIYNCHNCGWGGTVVSMKPKKEYTKPPAELKKLSDKVINWFAGRKISNQTLLRYQVSEGVEYFPQVGEERRCINFNYIKDGEIFNIKHRDGDKNFKLVSGAMLGFFGMDVCNDSSSDTVAILEGEPDVLACYEAGIQIGVSVPNGASKGDQKLGYLDEMWPFLDGRTVYLACDLDEPGIALRNELARRIGKENCFIVEFPEKDANDTLIKHGPEVLKQCFENARPFPVEGLDEVAEADIMQLYDEGFPKGLEIGWSNMDHHFNWFGGQVTMVTGIPGHGKTTAVKNIIARLSLNHGLSHMIYSAEEASSTFAMTDLMSIITNKAFFQTPMALRMTKEEVQELMPFMNSSFKYYNLEENECTVESILSKAKEAVRSFGVWGIVIDNMSSIERTLTGGNKHDSIGDMMRDLRAFARRHGVHIFIIAHPKKMSKINGVYEVPSGYDISDSSHYYNSVDNGMTVYRRGDVTEIHWWKIRFKYTGTLDKDCFIFNQATSRFQPTAKLNDGTEKGKFLNQPVDQGNVGRYAAAGSS